MSFLVTKRFTSGVLHGITITERCPVAFRVGREVKACAGGGTYIVEACIAATPTAERFVVESNGAAFEFDTREAADKFAENNGATVREWGRA
jgi:hypothetical protein